jgi:high-affinity iron transporter
VVLSILAGILFARASNQALWEGCSRWSRGILVASLTVHMWRAGKRMKRDIETRLEASSARVGRGAFLGVLGFTLLMMTREGMETALLMNTLLFSVGALDIIGGAVAGRSSRPSSPFCGRDTGTGSTFPGSSRSRPCS